jgi:hypothetical protein
MVTGYIDDYQGKVLGGCLGNDEQAILEDQGNVVAFKAGDAWHTRREAARHLAADRQTWAWRKARRWR